MSNKMRETLISVAVTALVNTVVLVILTFFLSTGNFSNGNKTVYTTKTGECYHLSGCESLSRSKHKTTLRDAVEDGYRSCSNCDAPILRGEDGFSFNYLHYIILVPFGALWAYIATSSILENRCEDTPHYLVHLATSFFLSAGFDFLF